MYFKKIINNIFDLFKTIFISIGLLLLFSLSYEIISKFIKNIHIAYIISYSIFIIGFSIKYKDYLKHCFNNIKNIKIKNVLKISFISIILIVLSQVLYNVLINYINFSSNTADINNNFLNSSKFLAFIQLVILGPIVEEFIFRLPYHKLKCNKFIKYLVYSLIFALSHINFMNLKDFIFIGTYLLLSLGIGYSYYKEDNILLSMIFHILNNAVMTTLLLV